MGRNYAAYFLPIKNLNKHNQLRNKHNQLCGACVVPHPLACCKHCSPFRLASLAVVDCYACINILSSLREILPGPSAALIPCIIA